MIPLKHFISRRSLPYVKGPSSQRFSYKDLELLQDLPVIPFIVSGLYFDLDYVLFFKDSEVSMLEICRTYLGDQEVWFTLESLKSGKQFVGIHEKDQAIAKHLFQLFPIESYLNKMKVDESDKHFHVSYESKLVGPLEFDLKKKGKKTKTFFFNGNTMNHSADIANPIIYLESLNLLTANSAMTTQPIASMMGLGLRFLISQRVCTFCAGEVELKNNELFINGSNIDYKVSTIGDVLTLRVGLKIGVDYRFQKQGKYLELIDAEAWQDFKGKQINLGRVQVKAPDLRYRHDEISTQQGNIFINEECMAKFHFDCLNRDELKIKIKGIKPFWFQREIQGKRSNSQLNWSMN